MSSKFPEIRAPDLEDLRAAAGKFKFAISDEDLVIYRDYIGQSFDTLYKEIDKYPDNPFPVNYRSTGSRIPTAEENPYNAWTRITEVKGSRDGRLTGKTIAVKDNISIAGVPLTDGSKFMEGFVPENNATVVERILDEGGLIKGTATCEDFCSSGISWSLNTKPVLNPRDTTRTTGGSSSGSAALVASGAVDMALGTDQGGSIRIPSSWCGVVGLKPSFGLVPYTHICSMSEINDFVGPIARNVKDCALLLEVIAGNDGLDARQPVHLQPKKYSELVTAGIEGVRVGILKEGFEGAEEDVERLVKAAANQLINVGAKVTEFSTDLHNRAKVFYVPIICQGHYDTSLNFGILQSKGFKDVKLQDFLHEAMKTKINDFPPSMKNLFLRESYIKERYGNHFNAKATNAIRGVVKEFDELFKQYDVFIMPTLKYKAPKIPVGKPQLKEFLDEHLRMTENTFPYNGTGHPALSVNVGYSEGLPVGMMIVGPHWGDDLVLRVGHHVEQLVAKM